MQISITENKYYYPSRIENQGIRPGAWAYALHPQHHPSTPNTLPPPPTPSLHHTTIAVRMLMKHQQSDYIRYGNTAEVNEMFSVDVIEHSLGPHCYTILYRVWSDCSVI